MVHETEKHLFPASPGDLGTLLSPGLRGQQTHTSSSSLGAKVT